MTTARNSADLGRWLRFVDVGYRRPERRSLGAASHVEFVKQRRHVVLHGLFGKVEFVARAAKAGRTLVFGEIDLVLPDGSRAAHATTTYMWT